MKLKYFTVTIRWHSILSSILKFDSANMNGLHRMNQIEVDADNLHVKYHIQIITEICAFCVFRPQTNVKRHPRWVRAKTIEAKNIYTANYALPLTPGPFSIIFRWNINRAVNNNPLYWTMHSACITLYDSYASVIERYAWTGSRDALDHSYSVENSRDNV